MSAITGTEPAHWHDEHGRHRMRDQRTIPGWDWENTSGDWSSPDERAYIQHLIAHEQLDEAGEPLPGDPPAVRALLEKIKIGRAIHDKEVLLVRALRQQHQAKENCNER